MNPIYVLALVSLALVAGGVSAQDGESKALLERLCKHKKDGPVVSQASQVKQMAEVIKNDPTLVCSEGVREAVRRLAAVVAVQNVCSDEAVYDMVDFWREYGKSTAKHSKQLPRPLKKFFLAFGYQTSKLCKETLMQNLEKATQQMAITDNDMNLVGSRVASRVVKIFGDHRIENLMSLVLPRRDKQIKMKTVKMDPKKMQIYRMQREICSKKLQPVYQALITPIVRLAGIGISYYGSVANGMAALEKSELYKKWFAVVLSCESSARTNPIEVSGTKKDTDGNSEMISFLDDEDLKELEKSTGISPKAPVAEQLGDYQIEPVQVDDLVLSGEKYLTEAISKHSTYLGTVTKFRARLMKNMPSIMQTLVEDKAAQFSLFKNTKNKKLKKFGEVTERGVGWALLLLAALLFGGSVTGLILTLGAASTLHGGPWAGAMAGCALGFVLTIVFFALSMSMIRSD